MTGMQFHMKPDAGAMSHMSHFGSYREYRVKALSLNFFDLVQRLGIMPSCVAGHRIPAPLGGHDFAASGPDEIFGMGAQASESLQNPQLSALRPRNVPILEASALPTVTLTVNLAFCGAQVTCGEVVLIHAGAGGVGLAAISAARRLGAQVLCSAGSAKKICFLRNRGVLQVAASRDGEAFLMDFYDLSMG